MKTLLTIFIISTLLFSCSGDKMFQSEAWKHDGEYYEFDNRSRMVNSLLKNYQLRGMNYNQTIDLLGKADDTMNFKRDEYKQLKYTLSIQNDTWHVYAPKIQSELILEFSVDSVVQNAFFADYSDQKNWDE